jgi:hypothetical protein
LPNRVHQVRLAQTRRAVEEEWVVAAVATLRDGDRRRVRQAVARADHEALEGEARIEVGARQGRRTADRRRGRRSDRRGRRLRRTIRAHELHHHREAQLLAQRLLEVALESPLYPVAPERAVQAQAHAVALDAYRRNRLKIPTAGGSYARQQRLHHIAPRMAQPRRADVLPKLQLLCETVVPAHRYLCVPALANGMGYIIACLPPASCNSLGILKDR